jgi:hypothetical protein
VKRHVRSSGVPRRKTRALLRTQIDEAKQLYVNEAWSISKLARHLGVADETVRKALLDDGVQLRLRGRPKSAS